MRTIQVAGTAKRKAHTRTIQGRAKHSSPKQEGKIKAKERRMENILASVFGRTKKKKK